MRPGGGWGVSWMLLPPKPEEPLKHHRTRAVQRWSGGQARLRRILVARGAQCHRGDADARGLRSMAGSDAAQSSWGL
jgi:hypothetical protein